jgi:hypothetical protein
LSKQERRLKKELEKFLRAGRYFEWLALVEKENLHRNYPREEEEAWNSLVKRALRLPANLQEFWTHLPSIKKYPSFPDFRCLLLLRDFVAGKEVRSDLAALRNLTFPAESLRQKALSWQDHFFPEKKIRGLLAAFLHHPEKVTPKYYSTLASLVGATGLKTMVTGLGSKFDGVRRLNRKTRGRRRLGPEIIRKVADADRLLKEVSGSLALPLQEILFYPFLFQVHAFFRERAEKDPTPILLRVASSMPFMFLKAAAEKGEEFQKHLLGASATLSDLDRSYLARTSEGSLEEKAALVARMRSALQKGGEEEYCDQLRQLYQSLLADLAARQGSLPERERRELARVMASSVFKDLPLLWTDPDDLEQLMSLFRPMAAMGLGNSKIAVLALILAEKIRDRDLKKQAQISLKDQGGVSQEDILWVLDSFPELIFPEVGSLRALVEVAGADAAFMPMLVDRVRDELQMFLITYAVTRRTRGPFAFFSELSVEDFKMGYHAWRRELAELKAYPPFALLLEGLACFPEGYFTAKGFQRYLNLQYEREMGLEWVIPELEKNRNKTTLAKRFLADSFLPLPAEEVLGEIEKAYFLLLEERFEGLKTAKLEALEKLTNFLLRTKPALTEGNLLIRISNLLAERLSGGESQAQALREKIMNHLIHHKQRIGKRGGR